MLHHVSGVSGISRSGRERKPAANVKPEIEFLPRVGVNVHEVRQILGSATQVQMEGPSIHGTQRVVTSAHPVVGQSGLGDSQKGDIFVTLMKQIRSARCV